MPLYEPLYAFADSNFLDDTGDLSTMYVNVRRIRYTIKADHPSTISQQLDDCKFRPLNLRSRPTIDIASPSDCRFRWFHSFDLRSPHHFCRRGSSFPHFSVVHWPRSCCRYDTSGRNREVSVSCLLSTVSALPLTCVPKSYTYSYL